MMKKIFFFLSMVFCFHLLHSQSPTVTGNVVDESDLPLPGVTILEQGTINGTTTDIDGNYSLSVTNAQSVLVFSYVGFTSQEITVGNRTTINVTLMEGAQTLDDVVVAFGTQKKSEVVGAVTTIRPRSRLGWRGQRQLPQHEDTKGDVEQRGLAGVR